MSNRFPALAALALTAFIPAPADALDCGRLEHSLAPYSMRFSTTGGTIDMRVARADGDRVSLVAHASSGRRYTLQRHGGFVTSVEDDSGTTAMTYTGLSLDTPLAVGRPTTYTVTSVRTKGKASPPTAGTTYDIRYLPDEIVKVGSCAFPTIHVVEEAKDGKDVGHLVRDRWFSSDLDINLHVIERRRDGTGTMRTVYEATPDAIEPDEAPGAAIVR